MTDKTITVGNLGSQAGVDVSELTRPADGVVVERQRAVIGDGSTFGSLAGVNAAGQLFVGGDPLETLINIMRLQLYEMQKLRLMLSALTTIDVYDGTIGPVDDGQNF